MSTATPSDYAYNQANYQNQRNRISYWEDFIGGVQNGLVVSSLLKTRVNGSATVDETIVGTNSIGSVGLSLSGGGGSEAAAVETAGIRSVISNSARITGRCLVTSKRVNQRSIFGLFFDPSLIALPENYLAIEFNFDQSNNWQLNSRFGNVDSYLDTGIPVITDTWYRFQINFGSSPKFSGTQVTIDKKVVISSVEANTANPSDIPPITTIGARVYGLGPIFNPSTFVLDYFGLSASLQR